MIDLWSRKYSLYLMSHKLWQKKFTTWFLFNCGRRLLDSGWLFFGIWIFWNVFCFIYQGCLSRIFFFGNIWQITEKKNLEKFWKKKYGLPVRIAHLYVWNLLIFIFFFNFVSSSQSKPFSVLVFHFHSMATSELNPLRRKF